MIFSARRRGQPQRAKPPRSRVLKRATRNVPRRPCAKIDSKACVISPFQICRKTQVLKTPESGQSKTKNVGARSDGNVLLACDGIAHRRGVNRLAHRKVPERLASCGVHCLERLRSVSKKNESGGGGPGAGGGIFLSDERVLPDKFVSSEIVGEQLS